MVKPPRCECSVTALPDDFALMPPPDWSAAYAIGFTGQLSQPMSAERREYLRRLATSPVEHPNSIGHGDLCTCSQCQRVFKREPIWEHWRDEDAATRILDMSANRDEILCKAADIQQRQRQLAVASCVSFVFGLVLIAVFVVMGWSTFVCGLALGSSVCLLWSWYLHRLRRQLLLIDAEAIGRVILNVQLRD